MKYKVSTKTLTEVWDSETLIKNHKCNKKLCNMIKKGVDTIIYQLTDASEIVHTIIFKRLENEN